MCPISKKRPHSKILGVGFPPVFFWGRGHTLQPIAAPTKEKHGPKESILKMFNNHEIQILTNQNSHLANWPELGPKRMDACSWAHNWNPPIRLVASSSPGQVKRDGRATLADTTATLELDSVQLVLGHHLCSLTERPSSLVIEPVPCLCLSHG